MRQGSMPRGKLDKQYVGAYDALVARRMTITRAAAEGARPARGPALSRRRLVVVALAIAASWCAQAAADPVERRPGQRVLVGISFDYPPFEYVDQNGAAQGYDVELARAVLGTMGLTAEFRPDAWNEVRRALANGEIDLAAGMLYSPERDEIYDFSVPHTIVHYSVFVRRSSPDIRGEEDLRGRHVVVERGSAMHDYLLQHNLGQELVLVDSEPAALRLLATGAHDCALAPDIYAAGGVARGDFASLRTSGPPLLSRELAFAVHEGDTALQGTLNEGLRLLKASGEYKAIQDRWFGVVEPPKPSFLNLLKYLAVPLLPLLGIAGAALSWSWTLRRRVAQQTQALRHELQEREKAQAALAVRFERERVLAAIAAKLNHAAPGSVESAVGDVLNELGEHMEADAAVFVEMRGGGAFAAPHGWTRPGAAGRWEGILPPPLDQHPWLWNEMVALRTIRVHDVAAMDGSATHEQTLWTSAGVTSVLMVPLALHGGLAAVVAVGMLGKTRTWRDDDELLLRAFGTAVVQALGRVRAEQATHTERDRLAVTLAAIREAVLGCDASGRVVLMNESAAHLLRRAEAECLGAEAGALLELMDVRTRERKELAIAHLVEGKRNARVGLELRLVVAAGEERLVSYAESVVRDAEGRGQGAVLVLRDITEEHARALHLQQAQKLESIGLLAGGIAHDFNNILTAILGNLSLASDLLRDGDPAAELLREAETASRRAQGLTRQLLTFAKGGAPVRRVVRLGETIRSAATFALRGSKVRCDLDIHDDLWPTWADAGQIAQVVQNLVINAKQAMPQGGTVIVKAWNRTSTSEADDGPVTERHVVVSVTDTGVGIKADDVGRIFDPYFTTKSEGSGLGLTTSHSIVRNHGGWFEVESEEGRGTTFRFYLPAADPDAAPELEEDASAVPGHGRILVMDDEPAILRVVAQMLTRAGYEPVCVTDGQAAIDAYEQARRQGKPFRAVVVDLTVPGGMGGKACVEALQRLDPSVKAIVSSGYSEDPVMADPGRHGFQGVLAKPYRSAELAAMLAKVLAR